MAKVATGLVLTCTYEAAPAGYGLARALHMAGMGCVVAAPGKIERPAADKVKTDQRTLNEAC